MKKLFAALILVLLVWMPVFSAPKGPQVDLIDNKLSIQAESISLSRLLRLVDMATGMKSKVPPELANRPISVRFSGLSLSDGFRKMFQGQPFDYVVIEGQGIIVTSASQTLTAADSPPPYNAPMAAQPMDQPFVQDFQSQAAFQQQQQLQQQQMQLLQQQQQQQPAMVQTPFGPMPNPRAQQNQQNPAAINQPQQNTLFPQVQPMGQPQQPVQVLPGVQPVPGNPNPFGTPSPFGTPNPPVNNQNNGLFGAVPVITPSAQPR